MKIWQPNICWFKFFVRVSNLKLICQFWKSNHIKLKQIKSNQINSCHVMSNQIKSNQIKSKTTLFLQFVQNTLIKEMYGSVLYSFSCKKRMRIQNGFRSIMKWSKLWSRPSVCCDTLAKYQVSTSLFSLHEFRNTYFPL